MHKLLLTAAMLGLGVAGASACDFHKGGHDTTAAVTTPDVKSAATVVASADAPAPMSQPARDVKADAEAEPASAE